MLRICFLLISISINSFSQNLVPNSSFENHSDCPFNEGQIEFVFDWFIGSSSPDYFNQCATWSDFSVPNNWGGYQQASTGQGYCAIGTYASYGPANMVRESLGAMLTSPLVPGTTYYCEFKLSLALSSNIFATVSHDKIGLRFSTKKFDGLNFELPPIDNFAHIVTSSIVSDSSGWVPILGTFVADSAYKYLYIGNFFDDSLLNIVHHNSDTDYVAYYYLDDIYVATSPSGLQKAKESNIIPFFFEGNLCFKDNFSGCIKIYDVLGNLATSIKDFNGKELNLTYLSPAIYIINLSTSEATVNKTLIIPY